MSSKQTIQLKISSGDHAQTLAATPGQCLRDLLDAADLRVRTACLGQGACGLCLVRLQGAALPPPTPAEALHIAPEALADGVRLACQLWPEGDLAVEILRPAPLSVWKSVPLTEQAAASPRPPRHGRPIPPGLHHPLAAAVDLGTTNIRIALLDLLSGRWLAECLGGNPQTRSGADVLSRLTCAVVSLASAAGLARLASDAIGQGLAELAGRYGIDLQRVAALAIVGNSAMLSLLANDRVGRLLDPAHWMAPLECRPADPAAWARDWAIHPQARIELVQPLAGFVGSDLLAGLVSTGLLRGPAPALLLDLGTNSEVALWDGDRLWVTSAAGGPAFEVSGYSSGIPAEPGAIGRVGRAADGSLRYGVLGETAAKGLCGSGLVDLVARLREGGELKVNGRFAAADEFRLPDLGGPPLHLTLHDVDQLQQAKAGIGAAVAVLCRHSGLRPEVLARLWVAGEFGRFLDPASAMAIGLLPRVPVERVRLNGDAALAGCAELLLQEEAAAELERVRGLARIVNLALEPDFGDLFIRNLFLREMAV